MGIIQPSCGPLQKHWGGCSVEEADEFRRSGGSNYTKIGTRLILMHVPKNYVYFIVL